MARARLSKKKGSTRRNKANVSNTLSVSYSPNVPVVTMTIPTVLPKYTTTTLTGVIANSTAIQASLMSNFSNRFQSFDEFRILQVRFNCNLCSSSNPGTINVWVEPLSTTTPTSAIAASNIALRFSAGSNDSKHSLVYRPADYAYLDWLTPGTTTSPVGWLNVYTDNANYGATVAVADYLVIEAIFTLQFRGLS